jgi:formylglycine-generating enzyme required for sulfatase activity
MTQLTFETVKVNDRGEIAERKTLTAELFVEDLGGGAVLELVRVPAQIYQMGSPRSQGYEDEWPLHPVTLSAFWIGRSPVTQQQYQALMGGLPACRFHGASLPLENVSWKEAQQFCRLLSQNTGRAYRLPGEAEWECACRAGSGEAFAFGPTLSSDLANYNGEFTYMQEPKGVYRHFPTPAGSFPANAYGIYDMHGNLWEWCADAWHPNYEGAPHDGAPWEARDKTAERVARGGSWHDTPNVCRSATRLKIEPVHGDEITGFRIARGE